MKVDDDGWWEHEASFLGASPSRLLLSFFTLYFLPAEIYIYIDYDKYSIYY